MYPQSTYVVADFPFCDFSSLQAFSRRIAAEVKSTIFFRFKYQFGIAEYRRKKYSADRYSISDEKLISDLMYESR